MSRISLAVGLLLAVGTVGWMIARPGKTAGAAEVPREVSANGYGENTEDVAQHRWVHNAPRHWRSLVVKR